MRSKYAVTWVGVSGFTGIFCFCRDCVELSEMMKCVRTEFCLCHREYIGGACERGCLTYIVLLLMTLVVYHVVRRKA